MLASATAVDSGRSVALGLAKIGLALRHHAWEERARTGLTPTQAQIVALLEARGPAPVGAIAELLAVSQPTVSDAIRALEEKGLVSRSPGSDRRVRLIGLTDAGAVAAAAASEWPDALLEAVDDLDPEDRAAFLRGLSSMIRSLQRRGRIPVQRMCVTCRYFRPHVHAERERPHHCAFVDAPFGDAELRLDCADHEEPTTKEAA